MSCKDMPNWQRFVAEQKEKQMQMRNKPIDIQTPPPKTEPQEVVTDYVTEQFNKSKEVFI